MGGNNSSAFLYLFSYLFSHLAKHLTRIFKYFLLHLSMWQTLKKQLKFHVRKCKQCFKHILCQHLALCLSKPGLRHSMQIISQAAERTLICWLQCRLPQICKYRFVMLCFTACFRESVPIRLPNKYCCSLLCKHCEIKINFFSPKRITEACMID